MRGEIARLVSVLFHTSGLNLKIKPFPKEKRLVFPLNDTQLFLPLSTFFPQPSKDDDVTVVVSN